MVEDFAFYNKCFFTLLHYWKHSFHSHVEQSSSCARSDIGSTVNPGGFKSVDAEHENARHLNLVS